MAAVDGTVDVTKVHHVGGLHQAPRSPERHGCLHVHRRGIRDTLLTPGGVTDTTLVLCVGLVVLMLIVTVCATAPVRARAHNVFEQSHRWGGWTAIVLFWVLRRFLTLSGRGDAGALRTMAWIGMVLAILTASVAWPWLGLARARHGSTPHPDHVTMVHLDYGVRQAYPSAVGISLRPLHEWHAFATVTSPDQTGYRLFIYTAGDWNGSFIDHRRHTSRRGPGRGPDVEGHDHVWAPCW